MSVVDSKNIDSMLQAARYKFLGWQNGWKSTYYDSNSQPTIVNSEISYFGYAEEDAPEWYRCRMVLKHRVEDIQHNLRGSHNTVYCDECKIYWKYDCSD